MLKRFLSSKSPNKSEQGRLARESSSVNSSFDVPPHSARGRSTSLVVPSKFGSGNTHGRSSSPTISELGLHILHDPGHASSDIIFVHGLGGHSHRTWTKNRDSTLFWPGSWLPFEPDVSTTRILTFGYNASWRGATKSISTITDFAKELLNEMRFARDVDGSDLDIGARPIIFVVHSLGGLVVKKAYLLGFHDETYSDLVQAISAVVFLSTPHRGTNLAETLNRIVSATMQAPKSFISDLNKSSTALEELNEQFRHIAPRLSIWSFYETLETSIGPRKLLILEKDSSILGYPTEISRPLHANHNSICKFESPSDSNYISVRNAITSLLSKSCDEATKTPSLSSSSATESFLRHCVTSADDYNALRRQWMPGTCAWFFDDLQASKVLQYSSSPQILWYSAPPASGKSVLAAFLVDYLRTSNRLCQHFFFKHAESSKRTVAAALRALVVQLATDIPEFKRHLVAASVESLGLDSNDAMVIWKSTFERILFGISTYGPIYWVIDALDECDSPKSLFDCLVNMSVSKLPITVVIISRHTESLAIGLDRISRQVPISRIETTERAHTQQDIALFVAREIEHLPGSAAFHSKLRSRILSQESIEEVLDETPDDMTELYQRMERNLVASTKKANKPLIQAILEWAVCAQRPLSLAEFSRALQPEFTGFLDLRRTFATACGQFVQVDDSDRVSMLHHTTREYFKSGNTSEFPINNWPTHAKLFRKTIFVLQNEDVQQQLMQHQYTLQGSDPFLFYSAVSWPYHLGRCTSDASNLLDVLLSFFKGVAVLSWIHSLALLRRLDVLVKASKALSLVTTSVRNHDASRHPMLHRLKDLEIVDRWAVDLLKLVGKFGRQLTSHPSIIYGVVPAFCPPDTALHQHCYDAKSSIVRLHGAARTGWNDHLGRVAMPGTAQAWEIRCAAKVVAVLDSTNTIHIWDSKSFAEAKEVVHGEPVTAMALADNGSKLATYGLKTTKLWGLPEGNVLAWASSPSESRAMTMVFSIDNSRLLAGCDDNAVRIVDCNAFEEGWALLKPELLKETAQSEGLVNSPMRIAFSPDGDHVAASYRGAPLSVWRLSDARCVGKCRRASSAGRFQRRPSTNWCAVDRFTWNPITGHILGIYRDGTVFKWHPLSNETAESSRAADEIAAAPTGKMFATSSSDGAIRLWNFAYFTVVYQLSSEDLVTGLAFSPGSQRFYDLRSGNVNAWEPNCLARALQDGEEQLSDTSSEDQSMTTTSKFSEARVAQAESVTAICVSPVDGPGPPSYCAGHEDGGVLLFESGTTEGIEITHFYNFLDVSHIVWSADGSHIACADLAGEVQIIKLDVQKGNGNALGVWRPQLNLNGGAIQGLVLKPDAKMLFVWTNSQGFLCDVDTGEMQHTTILEGQRRAWVCHSGLSQYLLGFGESDLVIYQWGTLELAATLKFRDRNSTAECGRGNSASAREVTDSCHYSADSILHVTQSASYIVLLAKIPDSNVSNITRLFAIRDIAALVRVMAIVEAEQPALTYKNLFMPLGSTVRKPLGVLFDSDLAFLDEDMWIHTVPVTRSDQPTSRHYFIPQDWVGTTSIQQCRMSATGTLFWPKEDSVVVVECYFDTSRAFI